MSLGNNPNLVSHRQGNSGRSGPSQAEPTLWKPSRCYYSVFHTGESFHIGQMEIRTKPSLDNLHFWWLEEFSTDGLWLHALQILFLFYYARTAGARCPRGMFLLGYDLWPLHLYTHKSVQWAAELLKAILKPELLIIKHGSDCKSQKRILLNLSQICLSSAFP